ncbi:MAG: diguanylate cyclase [Burkholderiaceae bacterium]
MKGLVAAVARALRSIKVRVTLSAVAALALGIALTTVVLVREAERDTLAAQTQRELREVQRTAAVLSQRVMERQRALGDVAGLIDEAMLGDERRRTAFLQSKPVLRGLFASIFLASPSGHVLSVSDDQGVHGTAVEVADRAYFKQTMSERRPVISEPLPSRLSPEPVVIFTYPLQRGGQVYGLVGGSLRLRSRDLLADLVDDPSEADGAQVWVSDTSGRFLAHAEPALILHSITEEASLAEGYRHWQSMGEPVEPAGLQVRQPGELVTVAGVAGPDWLVWRAQPESVLLAPLHAARRQALTWAAAIVLGCSLLVLATIGRLLHPLSQLKQRASSLFDEGADIHAGWPQTRTEVGELARVLRHVGAERARLERFNAQVLARLESVLSAAPLGIAFVRGDGFELVSAEMGKLLGRPADSLLGQPARTIFAEAGDYDALRRQVAAAFAAGRRYEGEWRIQRADGSRFWGELRAQPVQAGLAEAGTIWTLADISAHVSSREVLEWSATHDPLTGLANRKLFEQRATRVLQSRPDSLPSAIVMIDLDRFKPINDSAGHAAGDAMLKLVAQAIGSRVRGSDLVARIGGDEFALLLENCPRQAAHRIALSVQDAVVAAVLDWQGQRLQVGASLGIAELLASTEGFGAWLGEADAACYQAKAAGRGTVRIAGGRALRMVAGEGA